MISSIRQMKSHRLVLLTAVVGLALSTCGPSLGEGAGDFLTEGDAVAAASRPDGTSTARAATDVQAAGFVPSGSVPGSATAPAVEFPPVVAQLPELRIDGVPSGRDLVAELMGIEGVSFATSVLVGDVPIASGAEVKPVRVAAVDPAGFRVLTPQVTADAVEVWQRLVEGDAAFTHDAGHRLSLPLGTRVPAGERSSLRVGAYASNGVPPVADAIVTKETAQALGLAGAQSVLVSLDPDADPSQVVRRIKEATAFDATVLEEPVPRRAFLTGAAAKRSFDPFTYIDNGDGMIQIDPGWVRRNIVYASVPVFRGQVLCHRLMIEQLRGALQEVVEQGLAGLIDPTQYGGCWVPRHIDFNPAKPLSMHAWGLAVDFNVSTNQLGAVPQMDMRIVEIFERWGFVWGGRWKRPDGMHFELGALMQSVGG